MQLLNKGIDRLDEAENVELWQLLSDELLEGLSLDELNKLNALLS